jgi:ribosomal protein S21
MSRPANAVVYPKFRGESVDSLLRELKKQLAKSNTITRYKAKCEFKSRSERRRQKSARARKRIARS